MYRNKMIELTSFSKQPSVIGSKLRQSALSDQITNDQEDSKYSKARALISKINNCVSILTKNKSQYFKTSRPEVQKQIHDEINRNITTANKHMKQLKPIIQQVNQQFEKQSREGNKSRVVDCNKLTLDASQAIRGLKNIEQKISDQMKSTLQRQATSIQGQNLSEQQMQDLINQPQKGQQMLKQMLLDSCSSQLQNAVSDIIDKCNDVKRLQKNMRQCLEMMEDLSDLVKLQGQKLLTIQEAIDGAQDHVTKGEVKLESGKKYHKKSQKKMCCIMMILLAIIGVIVIPIVITQV